MAWLCWINDNLLLGNKNGVQVQQKKMFKIWDTNNLRKKSLKRMQQSFEDKFEIPGGLHLVT